MRIAVAPATPGSAAAVIRFADAAGTAPAGIQAGLAEALAQRLKHAPVALLPTLGHSAVAALALVKPPRWDDAVETRRRGGAVARALVGERIAEVALLLPHGVAPAQAVPFLVGLAQGGYAWDRYLAKPQVRLDALTLVVQHGEAWRAAADAAASAATWVERCRDLVNLPAADLGPAEFQTVVRGVARGAGLRLRVLDERACRRLGMGCLLAVGRASPRRPRMLVLELRGRRAGAPLALCGKGVCFDTGGLNLKGAEGMALMRKDMGGAATALCALAIRAGQGRPERGIRVYLPLVENAVGGDAFRPGDVLRALDGTTIEVGNTDAEGRLILADAIALARREGAGTIISVATLTGAAMTALGRIHVPLMASDDALAGRILAAAAATGEKAWRLPLDGEHRALVRGQVAQLNNAPGGGEAGCIAAGAFLAHFAGDLPFAHLDISPASWMPKPWDLGPAGATGTMVTTLAEAMR